MSNDKLQEVPRDDLPKLRSMFLRDWPNHCLGYGTLQNYEHWYKKDPNYSDGRVYCLNGDWSDGSFMVIVSFYN